jgi:hypothetical protein
LADLLDGELMVESPEAHDLSIQMGTGIPGDLVETPELIHCKESTLS